MQKLRNRDFNTGRLRRKFVIRLVEVKFSGLKKTVLERLVSIPGSTIFQAQIRKFQF